MTGVAANSAASVLGRAFRAALLIPYVAAALEAPGHCRARAAVAGELEVDPTS
jgi:hypothetical protein